MAGTVLIVGATRGLGASLAQQYLSKGFKVLGTARGSSPPSAPKIQWIPSIDLTQSGASASLASACRAHAPIDLAVVTAGYMSTESLDKPDWEAEQRMYTLCSIAPVFVVQSLVKEGLLKEGKGEGGGKVILVSSEGGSIALRHEKEGGGMYGHHGSKAALNMVGKLLSLDLKEKGIPVGLVHVSWGACICRKWLIVEQPGFMRTEMTKGVGFDKFWDEGGGKYCRLRGDDIDCELIWCS